MHGKYVKDFLVALVRVSCLLKAYVIVPLN